MPLATFIDFEINPETGKLLADGSVIFSFPVFLFCYVFLLMIFDDPKYPDGNTAFERNVRFVLEVQKNNYKIPFPGTVGMYERAKHDMEQYKIKHGIEKVGMGVRGGFDQIYFEFESPEAKDKYFQNVDIFYLEAVCYLYECRYVQFGLHYVQFHHFQT